MTLKLQRTLLLLALIVSVATLVLSESSLLQPFQPKECEENMEFSTCGTACPDKCSDKPDVLRICTENCIIGCRCKKDYVLNDAGKCVLTKNC